MRTECPLHPHQIRSHLLTNYTVALQAARNANLKESPNSSTVKRGVVNNGSFQWRYRVFDLITKSGCHGNNDFAPARLRGNSAVTYHTVQWRIYIVKFWIRPPGPIFFILMQFSWLVFAKFVQIIGWRPLPFPPFGLTPHPHWELLDPPLQW